MSYNSNGIVIQFVQKSRHKIALLDYHKGRIDGVTSVSNLSLGSVISYTLRVGQTTHFIENVELLYLPLSLARTDLLFLHHILELLYQFSPVSSCVVGIFALFKHLYANDSKIERIQKKLFLFKLFYTLGVTPEPLQKDVTEINQLAHRTIDQLYIMQIDNLTEKKLDKWLWYCIYQHPYANELKTTHFLDENRTP